MMKKTFLVLIITVALLLCACQSTSAKNTDENASADAQETVEIQILSTSDIHGRFLPYDYLKNCEDYSGSLAQVSTLVNTMRNDNTVLIDVGDYFKGNLNEIYVDELITPMAAGLNKIGYNLYVPGNHGFNYGPNFLKNAVKAFKGHAVLCGNVYKPDGTRLAKPYYIHEIDGVKIGFIGMTTPNIQIWDKENLKDWTVTDPVAETNKAIEEIKDKVDVIVAAVHMDIENELGTENSGVRDLAEKCPELDLILAAHGHTRLSDYEINNIPIIENYDKGRSVGRAVIKMVRDEGKWKIEDISTASVLTKDYEPDPEIVELLMPYHQKSVESAGAVIGTVIGGNLKPDDEIPGISSVYVKDTPISDLFSDAMLAVSGAKVTSSYFDSKHGNIYEGDIHIYDIASAYTYDNTAVMLRMNGAQLKKWMEWSAAFYNKYREGDLTVSFNPEMRGYQADFFEGVNYEVNISKEAGNRIENLIWPDGTPVRDDDEFDVLTSDYRASTVLTKYGEIFEEGDKLPTVSEKDYNGKGMDMRQIVGYYITNNLNGVVKAECNNNWKLTGYSFDSKLRQRAAELVREGKLTIVSSPNGRNPNIESITVDDVLEFENG